MTIFKKKTDLITNRDSNIYTNNNKEITATMVNSFIENLIDSIFDRLAYKVQNKSDLITLDLDIYVGMICSVYGDVDNDNNGLYILTSTPHTMSENWLRIVTKPKGLDGALQYNNANDDFGGSFFIFDDSLKTYGINSNPVENVTLTLTSRLLYSDEHTILSIGVSDHMSPLGDLRDQIPHFEFNVSGSQEASLKIRDFSGWSYCNLQPLAHDTLEVGKISLRPTTLAAPTSALGAINYLVGVADYSDGLYMRTKTTWGGEISFKRIARIDPYQTRTVTSGTQSLDCDASLTRRFIITANTTITINNIYNGFSGSIIFIVDTNGINITLSTGLTNKSIGDLNNLSVGHYVVDWKASDDTFYYEVKNFN